MRSFVWELVKSLDNEIQSIFFKYHTYIVIHRQTVSLSCNSSEWLDKRGASSWDRNAVDFTSVGYPTPNYRHLSVSEGIF